MLVRGSTRLNNSFIIYRTLSKYTEAIQSDENFQYFKRRKNSIAAIFFKLLYEKVGIFVVWLGRFEPFAK